MSLNGQTLIEFLKSDLAIDVDDITDETPLFSSGIIDSFALISLMTFIETEGGIRISPADVNLSNFDSISRITNFATQQIA